METPRRLVRRIPAEGLDPCGYGDRCFSLCQWAFDCSLYSDMYLPLLYCIKAVVYRLYEMLYPCTHNVVISCWKFGAYDFVICRGGTDMCFVPGSGWKHLDLEQYRYRALQLGIRALPTVGSLLWPKSSLDKNYFVVTYRRVGIFLLLTLSLVRTSVVSVSNYRLIPFKL